MYGKVKLTKRQIKEDKFMTFMLNAKHEILERWQYYVIGVAAVILIVVAVIFYFNSQEANLQEASEKFSRALIDYRSGSDQVALLGLADVVNNYPDTRAARQAAFLLAKINYESQNYSEALRYFELFANKYKEDALQRASALGGIGGCYENQGNYAEAARRFAIAANEYPEGPLAGDYRMSAMRNFLLAGDIESARTHLDVLKEKFAGTTLERQAVRLFAEKSES
ncbi:MAG: tetratricopeptide repeat protein [Candidatus Zixiibacteriota bacterium]